MNKTEVIYFYALASNQGFFYVIIYYMTKLKNTSFENGWIDIVTGEDFGWLINQQPNDWHLRWLGIGESLFGSDEARGVPECVHKMANQLPPDEQPGGSDPLILDGEHTYKVFHNGAAFGAELWQIVEGLKPGTIAKVTVPIRIHAHGEKNSPDMYSAESGVWMLDDWTVQEDLLAPLNGSGDWVPLIRERQWDYIGGEKSDGWVWYYHTEEIPVPASGAVCVLVRVKSKWDKPVDFFIDALQFEATPEDGGTEPPIEPPPSDRHKVVILKIPQEYDGGGWFVAANWAYKNYKRTQTASTDDMMTMMAAGNDESRAVIIDPWLDSQKEAIFRLDTIGWPWEALELGTPPTDEHILDVPHMTQVGNAISDECGAACAAMVINGQTPHEPTVDEIAEEYQNPPNSYMTFAQIGYALKGYDVDGTYERPFMPEEIEASVRIGLPVTALVHYPAMPKNFVVFNGSHFIVIYGAGDGYFLYRDPLQVEGTRLEITHDELLAAMAQVVNDGNMAYQGMMCESVYVPPVDPPTGEFYTTKDFMQPDPRSFVVVDRAEHGGENISTVFKDGQEYRVKNGAQMEVYEWRDGACFRIKDTSPADDPDYGPCLYLQYADPAMTQPGGQIAPARCQAGVTYEYWSQVQFKSKDGCQNLPYRSGWARSTFCLDAVTDNYTFENGVTVDRLYETTQTGEKQLYTLKDGIMRGWSGGGAKQHDNRWGAMPIEFYLDRAVQPVPPGYCN